jgi:hypothetical protein
MTHTLPRVLLVTGLAGGASLFAAAPAAADAPERTGWWNRTSVGGSTVPQPTTENGGLHVGNDVQGPNAIAALHYQVAGKPDQATLTLKVTANRTVGTPKLRACPVTSDGWKAGADQPWSAAPHYRCAGHSSPGSVSDDGKSVTWSITGEQQLRPGVLDLAIVPATGSDPFSIDFAKPGAASLSMSSSASLPPPPGNPAPPPDTSAADGKQDLGGPLSPGKLPNGPGSKDDPGAGGNVRLPEVAPQAGAAQAANARQATAGLDPDARREIALAALVVTAFALMYAGLQQQRRPLGMFANITGTAAGRADGASATSAADTTGGPSTTARNHSVAAPVRGLGRFARPRNDPPHRL